MPITVRRLVECVEALAPPGLAEAWDNVGLQVGAPDAEIRRVLLTVDVTRQVLDEAAGNDAGAIVAHHPVLFGEIGSLRPDRWPGCVVVPLVIGRRALIVAHTNLDWSPAANTSAALAEWYGFSEWEPLQRHSTQEAAHLGVVVEAPQLSAVEVIGRCHRGPDETLEPPRRGLWPNLGMHPAATTTRERVAVVAGSGKGLQEAVLQAGAKALVAGEIGHHAMLELQQLGVRSVEIGHADSERPAIEKLARLLEESLEGAAEVVVSEEPRGVLA